MANDEILVLPIDTPQRHYFNIEIIAESVNPSHSSTDLEYFANGGLLWKSVLTKCLSQLYGLIGEAIPLDILHISNICPTKSIIRTDPEDKEKVINSIMSYTFRLSEFVGGDSPRKFCIRINKDSNYLGLVLDKEFY